MKFNFFFLAVLLTVFACKSDDPKQQKIVGNWELTYGEMNGRPAPGLESIYFRFSNDSIFTNFNASATDEVVKYTIEKDKIHQNSEPKMIYQIESLSDTVMTLKTALQGRDFSLRLVKK